MKKSALKTVSEYTMLAKASDKDILGFFHRLRQKLLIKLKKYKHPLKISLAIQVKLKKIEIDGERIIRPWFNTDQAYKIYVTSNVPKILNAIFFKLNDNFESFLKLGSGWTLERIKALRLKIAHFSPISGSLNIEPNLPI